MGLYHCTKYAALKSILSGKEFWPSYCLERASFMPEYTEGAYAVVCFADLLRNEVGRHMKSFHSDSYIVMNKQLAVNNFISPVTYYVKNSITSATFKEWLTRLAKENKSIFCRKKHHSLLYNATNMFVPFMKQYEGEYYNKNIDNFSSETRTFYLEREWRWCPFVYDGEAYYLTKEMYLDKDKHNRELERLRKKYTLQFEWGKNAFSKWVDGRRSNKYFQKA